MDHMDQLFESAAKLQEIEPSAVLVGGTAATFHAHHRYSYDHDHVVQDLQYRYDIVLDNLSHLDGWTTNARVTKPPMTIMGDLDGYQAGLRNLRRKTPLEVEEVTLPSGKTLRVPTLEETLRIKAFLIVQRNQVRDYLDVAALSEKMGVPQACSVLSRIDDYYEEFTHTQGSVLSELVAQLSDPDPHDAENKHNLAEYKGVTNGWGSWETVENVCKEVASCLA